MGARCTRPESPRITTLGVLGIPKYWREAETFPIRDAYSGDGDEDDSIN